MLTWIRSHITLVAVSAVVLAVALSSSATAALVITGKNIKNETIKSKDVKNGSLKVDDLSAAARATLQGTPATPTPPTPPYVGSACTLPNSSAGTVTMQVAANGSITLICAVPAAAGQNGDLDHDGYLRTQECKDSNAAVHPGVTEVLGNLYDDDCDGTADDGSDTVDHDGDGDSIQGGDCDDTDTTVAFGNTDTFGDGLDEDCDGIDG